mmetsp:Transcript_20247/g.36067  ORF Transcript_20247/g.36067 Transcript_20247/m.36067 type:complete len:124 (-) Transcript_20247:843-1214(-)
METGEAIHGGHPAEGRHRVGGEGEEAADMAPPHLVGAGGARRQEARRGARPGDRRLSICGTMGRRRRRGLGTAEVRVGGSRWEEGLRLEEEWKNLARRRGGQEDATCMRVETTMASVVASSEQ